MQGHNERVRAFNAIPSKETRRRIIEASALDDIDTQIMLLRHIGHKSFGYIADTVGLSASQVSRRYVHAIKLIFGSL